MTCATVRVTRGGGRSSAGDVSVTLLRGKRKEEQPERALDDGDVSPVGSVIPGIRLGNLAWFTLMKKGIVVVVEK